LDVYAKATGLRGVQNVNRVMSCVSLLKEKEEENTKEKEKEKEVDENSNKSATIKKIEPVK
jgi:RNA polymerase-interacting CarD/CdnL/TRCF family regulator